MDATLAETGNTTSLRTERQLEVFAENQAAGLQVVSIRANKGDVVIFHGRLLHRTGPTLFQEADKNQIGKDAASCTRHVLANHYIPKSFQFWPPLWLTRMHVDRESRAADGKTTPFMRMHTCAQLEYNGGQVEKS